MMMMVMMMMMMMRGYANITCINAAVCCLSTLLSADRWKTRLNADIIVIIMNTTRTKNYEKYWLSRIRVAHITTDRTNVSDR